MSLKVYNSLTRQKEQFQTIHEGQVKMYVCGPTVYDYIHIGNARPLIFFDVVRRYLETIGNEVQFILNFTDVDDKLIDKAEELGISVIDVADRFIQAYFEDAEALGIEKATEHPRVTEHIPEIIEFIASLVDKGYAYATDGDVYFRTHRFEEYGKLSQQNLEELQHGIRIEVSERKEHAHDFVLWKAAKPGEINWQSPWGSGRPGWHIECSAMAKKFLGVTIDIHGGGQDLQFPHHECELAQSEALHGKPLANYWIHNGYIHIDNEKMSKSLGNGVQVKELLKHYKPEALRYFMLSTHYRNPLNFSDEVMKQSEQSIARIHNSYQNVLHRLKDAPALTDTQATPKIEKLERIEQQFHLKMQDDFNTSDALTAVFDLVAEANQYVKNKTVNQEHLEQYIELFNEMNQVLGIIAEESAELLDEDIEQLIEERTEARKAKNWARADEIRDILQEQNIVLEDTPQGMRWRRK